MNFQPSPTNTHTKKPRKVTPINTCLILGISGIFGLLCVNSWPLASASEPVNPLTREFTIRVDPTALTPQTWWHVPGVTPLIWTMDPASSEAYRTTEAREVKLKPGEYRFGTFTFDFAFRVTLAGTLEYSQTLDQCVDGRGTQHLAIRCSHTQPYPQEPDYYETQN